MSNSTAESTGAAAPPTHLVGCAVMGPKHEDPNERCEDAWAGERLDESRAVIAVGDGLGSAGLSHRGSELATDVVTSELTAALGGIDSPSPQQLERLLFMAFKRARAALYAEADSREVDVSEFNTTLLVGVTTAEFVGGAAVGDGGLIYRTDGSTDLLVPREGLEYANETLPLPNSSWQDSYRFGMAEGASAVAAFSDGLDTFAWDGVDSVQDAVFDQLFGLIEQTDDSELIESELASFLDADRFRDASDDDKTIAIATTTEGARNATSSPRVDADTPPPSPPRTESPRRSKSSAGASRAVTAATERADATGASEATATAERPATTSESSTARRSPADTYTAPSPNSSPGARSTTNASSTTGERSIRPAATTAASTTDSDETSPADELEGTSVIDDAGIEIELAELLDAGPGWCWYATVADDSHVVTVSRSEWRTAGLEARIETLLERGPPTDLDVNGVKIMYQWPTSAITMPAGEDVVGYTLPWDEPTTSANLLEFARWDHKRSTVRHRLSSLFSSQPGPERGGQAVAREVAVALSRLHSREIALGAFSHERIRVGEETLYVLTGDHAHVSIPEAIYHGASPCGRYRPPEAVEGELAAIERSDRFALGVHIYQLLMGGRSPFERSRDDDARTLKPHLRSGYTSRLGVGSSEASDYDELPELIRFHLERCLHAGWNIPERRPTAEEWVKILTRSLR